MVPLAAILLDGCHKEPKVEEWFEHDPSAFDSEVPPHLHPPFDVIAADFDRDGDPDVLVNWHHLAHMELFENHGGQFDLLNDSGSDETGLSDNPGIVDLYADRAEMDRKIDANGKDGVYLWHHPSRVGNWRVRFQNSEQRYGTATLHFDTNLKLDVYQLDPKEWQRTSPSSITVSWDGSVTRRDFAVRTQPIGVHLGLTVQGATPQAAPPLFVGSQMTPWPTARLDVWKTDPHGMAWVDVEGSDRPELFITRGGLAGRLKPPMEPKHDRYYRALSGEENHGTQYELAARSTVPAGYGRGRRVEWVDVDGDTRPELSIANRRTPNSLLAYDAEKKRFHDRAGELAIDFQGGDVQAWGDMDGDGFDDLLVLEDEELRIYRNPTNRNGHPPSDPNHAPMVRLPLPQDSDAEVLGLFDHTALRLADFNGDGRLDIWILARAGSGRSRIFAARDEGFEDITERSGLDQRSADILVVLLDINNDGFEDAVSFGRSTSVWENINGQRFAFHDLEAEVVAENVRAATVLDADGDGATDLLVVDRQARLLRNVAAASNGSLRIEIRSDNAEPVGAVVRAHYKSGRIVARRYGSVHSGAYSQTLQPLLFGVPSGDSIERVGVRWPGSTQERFHQPPAQGEHLTIRRD